MYTRIRAIYEQSGGVRMIDIYGHVSNSLPGLEIHGVGPWAKLLKEKFIYLNKSLGLSIPAKKYSITVEDFPSGKQLPTQSMRLVELPLLILYWSLAKQIPLSKLDDCYCCGVVSIDGKIEIPEFSEEMLLKDIPIDFKVITHSERNQYEEICALPLQEICCAIQGLKILKMAA